MTAGNGHEPIEESYDVVVVGAGLAGLTAAVTAARAGASVLALDAHATGGRATVDRLETDVGEVLFNRGPHALYNDGVGRRILVDLGIEPTGGTPPLKGSWAYRSDGTFELMPLSAGSLLRTSALGPVAKVRAGRLLAGLGRIDPGSLASMTAADWVSDRSGGSPAAIAVLRALIRVSSYASDLDTLSAEVAAGQLAMAGRGGVTYLHGGFQQLVDALASKGGAAGTAVRTDVPVRSIEGAGDGWTVRLDGGTVAARSIVLAAGGPESSRRLLGADPGWGALGPDVTAVCLEIATRVEPERRFALGLDAPLYLSTHCPPASLAPAGVSVVHLMRYGPTDSASDRAELEQLARRAGIAEGDVLHARFLARMVVAHAQATADRGGLAGRPPVEVPGRDGLFVAGDWVGPVGHLSDASIASGASAGQRAAARVRRATVVATRAR